MKYAWYVDDNNAGTDFCHIENKPMELDDALSLTCDMSAERAFSVPAFETDIIANKVNYDEDYEVDGEHSILAEVAFEEWLGKNYLAFTKEISSYWEIPSDIKDLYNKGFIKKICATKSAVTLIWVRKEDHYKEQRFILSKDKDFENKSFEKVVSEDDYYSFQNFCRDNL